MHLKTNCMVAGLSLALAWGAVANAAEPEGRAIWWHPEKLSPEPAAGRAQIEAFVKRCALANLNLILPWTRSDYLVALDDPKYQKRFPTAKWDALGCLIETAAKHHIQVHLWYSLTYYKEHDSPEFNPEAGGNPDWAAVREDELVPGKDGKVQPRRWADVCNLHADARTFTLNLLEKTLQRYPKVGGLHIEEPGFGYAGNCVCPLCQSVYKEIYGTNIVGKTQLPAAVDLKCLATTDFMRRLREMMLKRDKSLILSTNGGYSWTSDRYSGRDWGIWAKHGWIDYYAPQIYVANTATLAERSKRTVNDIGRDTHVYVGIRLRVKQEKDRDLSAAELCEFVKTIRAAGARGIALFWADVFTDAQAEALRNGPFNESVPLPAPPRSSERSAAEPWTNRR
jgi:uncharacterized lipoprotein YddW (UPF0748 family)